MRRFERLVKYRIVIKFLTRERLKKFLTRERLKRGGLLAAWVGGVAVLAGVVFVTSFYLAMKVEMRSTEVVVPDLDGLSLEDASEVVKPLGLEVDVVDRRHDRRIASGRVLQQQPKGGSRVRRGRKLKLVLSLGDKILVVPDLVGKADRAVEIELRRDGFGLGNAARVVSSAPAGRILAQDPQPGSPGVPNTRVHRLVSEGREEPVWVMPDLTGLPRQVAETWIDRGGFRRSPVRGLLVRGRPSGTVIGQSPLAGYPLRPRDVVELTVAR